VQNTGLWNQLIQQLIQSMDPGAQALHVHMVFFLRMFIAWEILRVVYAALWRQDLLGPLMNSVIRAGLVYWLFDWWPLIMGYTRDTMVGLGLLAGSNPNMTIQMFLDPAAYANMGFETGQLLHETAMANMGLTRLGLGLVYFGLYCLFMLSFLSLGTLIAIVQIEFHIVAMASLILLPCLATRSLSWCAQGSIAYVVNSGMRFFLCAFLSSLTFPLLRQLTLVQPVSVQSVLLTCATSFGFTLLFWRVNRLASTILSGQPSLGVGDLIGHGIMAATTAVGIGSAGAAAGAAGSSALASTARGGYMAGAAARAGVASLASGGGPGAAFGAARTAASSAGSSGLMSRVSSFAGAQRQSAASSGARSLRAFADVSRLASGGDAHAGYGVRR
jgi:type IV secretory pathway TrbL component